MLAGGTPAVDLTLIYSISYSIRRRHFTTWLEGELCQRGWISILLSTYLGLGLCFRMLSEVECFEVFTALTLAAVHEACNFLVLVLATTTVNLDKLVQGQVSTSDSDNDGVALGLHKDPLPVQPVHTWTLALEAHSLTHLHWLRVDVGCQSTVDRVILDRFIDEWLFHLL